MPVSTAPPTTNKTFPNTAGAPKTSATEPTADAVGAIHAQLARSATARSTAINVPKKPRLIKMPWSLADDVSAGSEYPSRAKPPHRPNSMTSTPAGNSSSPGRRGMGIRLNRASPVGV